MHLSVDYGLWTPPFPLCIFWDWRHCCKLRPSLYIGKQRLQTIPDLPNPEYNRYV